MAGGASTNALLTGENANTTTRSWEERVEVNQIFYSASNGMLCLALMRMIALQVIIHSGILGIFVSVVKELPDGLYTYI